MTRKEIQKFVRGFPGKVVPPGLKVVRIGDEFVRVLTPEGVRLHLSLKVFEEEIVIPFLEETLNKKYTR